MPNDMRRALLAFAVLGCLEAGLQAGRPLPAPGATAAVNASISRTADPAHRALLDRYCATCHNERLRTANLALEGSQVDLDRVGRNADVWEKVLQKLRTGAMPPPGRPRPDQAASDALASWLETSLDAEAAAHPNPGRPTAHRL